MDKQIQFSINRNLLIVVSIIILLLLLALSARGGRGRHDMRMMRQGGQGQVMMQKKMPAGTPIGEEQRLMRPPTQAQLEATSTMLQ